MSDFPHEGSVEATRQWLDDNKFHNCFIDWSADALIGASENHVTAILPGEPGMRLWGLLNTARAFRSSSYQDLSILTSDRAKICTVQCNGDTYSVGFPKDRKPRDYVIETLKSSGKSPSKRGRNINWEEYVLMNSLQHEVLEYFAIQPGETLYFQIREKLRVLPPSEWKELELQSLRIVFTDISESIFLAALEIKEEVLLKAEQLIDALKFLSAEQSIRQLYDTSFLKEGRAEAGSIEEMRSNSNLEHPIAKALFLIQHYSTTEGIVDGFLHLLFWYMGFYEGMLFPFPQKKLKLYYSNGELTKEAKPDYTVMDVLSFYRVAVCEDKNCDELNTSEPQMIAEAIAVHQANIFDEDVSQKKKRKIVHTESESSSVVYGIRVHGYRFFFYIIPVGSSILNAFRTQTRAIEETNVSRLGGTNGLSFLDPEHRKTILKILNGIQYKISTLANGEYRDQRLNSASNKSSLLAERI